MSCLSYEQIKDLIEDGVIEHASYQNVNSASLDITLGDIIMVESLLPNDLGYKQQIKSLSKREPLNFKTINLEKELGNKFILAPGQFILASSREIFHLPNDISAEYKLKSSMARMGLDHLNAGWCDAGWNNSVLTLELRNLTTYHYIELTLGDKIGQMVFFKHLPVPIDKSYASRGSYNGDRKTQHSKEKVSS